MSTTRTRSRPSSRFHLPPAAALVVLAGGLLLAGCEEPRAIEPDIGPEGTGAITAWDEANLQYAVDALFELDRYANLHRYGHKESREALFRDMEEWIETGDPPLAWLPSPAEQMRNDIVDRLNQWIRYAEVGEPWQRDPLLESLPERLRDLPQVQQLPEERFTRHLGQMLQANVWLRDTANRARGEVIGDVPQARALFDWTVRNLRLPAAHDEAETKVRMHLPWQAMLLGRATPEERAWIFMLLARQQRLDVVALGIADEEKPDAPARFWAAALVSEGDLHLFDPRLGLPIPGPDGERVATLAEVKEDPTLLEQLNVGEHTYPVSADDLQHVVALIEASPTYLDRSTQLLARRLAGERQLFLHVEPSRLAEEVAEAGVPGARLWTYPYEALAYQSSLDQTARRASWEEYLPLVSAPTVWKGRLLHLRGETTGEEGAGLQYHRARPSDARIAETIDEARKVQRFAAKRLAGYWLGLITFETGNYDAAVDYFAERTIEAYPESDLRTSAEYQLGRTYEAKAEARQREAAETQQQIKEHEAEIDRLEQAAEQAEADGNERLAFSRRTQVKLLREETGLLRRQAAELRNAARGAYRDALPHYRHPSPQLHGNLLRARRIEGRLESLGPDEEIAETPAENEQEKPEKEAKESDGTTKDPKAAEEGGEEG